MKPRENYQTAMKLLEGKTVLVTGASRGIGRGIALKMAEAGASVAFTYLSSPDKAAALEQMLQQYGTQCKGYRSDASSFSAAEELISSILADFGGLDAVVNNAGITRDNLLMRMTEEQFDEVIKTNLKSVFNITRACQKPMLKARKGSIINISSIVGVKGNAGQSNYAASKAGVIGFTKSIALELGSRNIRCNAIAPGFIETEMTEAVNEEAVAKWKESIPMKKAGTVEDVANVVLFLASDMSAYVTGQTINVCGGLLT